jgi:hypothetical protein
VGLKTISNTLNFQFGNEYLNINLTIQWGRYQTMINLETHVRLTNQKNNISNDKVTNALNVITIHNTTYIQS